MFKYGEAYKKRSIVWEFFYHIETDKVKCRKCSSVLNFLKNTTNLHDHIKRKHEIFLQIEKQNLPNELEGPQQSKSNSFDIVTKHKPITDNRDYTLILSTSSNGSSHTKKLRQLRLTSFSKGLVSEEV